MSWQEFAACKGATELFFPAKGDHATMRKARAICATCPVTEQCLDDAVGRNEQHGIWGGLSVKALRAVRRDRREEAA